MFDNTWPGWLLMQSGISGFTGFAGVIAGVWITGRNQKHERLIGHYRQQLQGFYSPMLAAKDEIKEKVESQRRVEEKATKVHKENLASHADTNSEELVGVYKYGSKQWMEEIFPLYKQMAAYFSKHMWLAEQSTHDHYYELVHIIEVWNRQYTFSLSPELSWELTFNEDELVPLYDDLDANFQRLRELLTQT
jgi:hypothetical protein